MNTEIKKAVNRVPHIITLYWIIKIAATTLGETGADMFSMTFNYGYGTTIAIFITLFAIALWVKLSLKRYEPISYWVVFTMSAILGTAVSDYIDRTLEFGYAAGSGILIVLLLMVLAVWYKVEKTVSVEKITTTGGEIYYWLAFLVANTLGTAAGDFLADDLNLGFLSSALIISGILLTTIIMNFYTKISKVMIFWIAFVFTRPFGATFGDLLTKSHEQGGLGLGTIYSSLIFAVMLLIALRAEVRAEKSKLSWMNP